MKKWIILLKAFDIDGDIFISSTRRDLKNVITRRFTPGGLRPGAATSDYLRTQNTSRTQWRGRWANPSVLRHYRQLGTYFLTAVKFAGPVRDRLKSFQQAFWSFAEVVEGSPAIAVQAG